MRRRSYLLVSLAVLVLDQATKLAAHDYLRGAPTVVVIPGLLNLTYSRNPGGLFGYFGNLAEPWRSVLLTLMPLLAIAMISYFLFRVDEVQRRTRFALALILGGAVGNLIDRLARGEVVDFLDLYAASPRLADWLVARFGTAHWPTFNLADTAIVIGAGLLVLDIVRPSRDETRRDDARPAGSSAPAAGGRNTG